MMILYKTDFNLNAVVTDFFFFCEGRKSIKPDMFIL